MRPFRCDSNRAIGVRWCSIRSTWTSGAKDGAWIGGGWNRQISDPKLFQRLKFLVKSLVLLQKENPSETLRNFRP